MATIQTVDATAGETSTVVDNSVVVTRTIDVSADIASNIHLLVQASTAAAPTASQVVASEALVASTTTATTATFNVPNLPSETAFTAYAVAATPSTGVAVSNAVADGSAFDGSIHGLNYDHLGLDVDLNADGTVAVVTMTHADTTHANGGFAEAGEVRVLYQTTDPPDQFGKMTWQQRGSDIPIGTGSWQKEGRIVQINATGDEILVAMPTADSTIKRMQWDGTNWNTVYSATLDGRPHYTYYYSFKQISASDDLSVLAVCWQGWDKVYVYYWNGSAYVPMTNGEQSHAGNQYNTIAVSGDGSTVAIKRQVGQGYVNTYNVANNTLTHDSSVDVIGPQYGVPGTGRFGSSIALSTDGLSIVIGTSDHNRFERFTRTGPTAAWTYAPFPAGTTDTANSTVHGFLGHTNMLAVSGDGNRMAHIDTNADGTIGGFKLVDFSDGSELLKNTGGFGGGNQYFSFSNINWYERPSIAVSRDGSRVIVGVPGYGSSNGYAFVYSIGDGSTQSAVTSHTFTTGDFTNPVASVTQGTVNIDSAQVNVTSSEAGTAYFLVSPAGSPQPDAATIKAANDTTSITAAGMFTHDLTGLAIGTAYVVYLLVEDNALQNGASQPNASDIQSLTFTTTSAASAHAASATAAVDGMSQGTQDAVADISAANITDQSSANTRSQNALEAISGDTAAFNAKSSAQKRELLRDVMKHAVTVATEGPADVQKVSVSGASFRAFVPDLAGDAGTALGLATTVDVVPPGATVTVGTAGTAVYCPLAVGESVTLTFEGTSVEWTKLPDGTTAPNTTFFGDAFLSWSGASSALQPGEQATLTASSGNKFHFFAGSVGGAGDGGNTGGTASGDPFVDTFL